MSASPDYHASTYQDIPHRPRLHTPNVRNTSDRPCPPEPSAYPNINAFDAQVLRSRAIAPNVAAARGTRTAGNRMIIPLWNTQGETGPEQYRPHHPTPGEDGKLRKYLFAKGTRLIVDVNPLSLPSLDKVHIPLIITESALKADATLSAIAPGTFGVVSVSGVDGWRSGDMPLSDFRDIPMRVMKRQKLTFRRPVYIAYDSDAATKPGPMRARWELTEYLRRRKAQVHWIDVPTVAGDPNPETNKQGIDDALASGHTMEAMLASAYPAPDFPPAIDVATEGDDLSKVERLEQRVAYLERENAYLIRLSKTPHLSGTDRAMIVNIGTQMLAKVSRGELEPDGRVRLTPAEISEDYRPKPEAGKARLKANPKGEPFLMTRSSVKGRAQAAQAAGLLTFELKATRKERSNGRPYVDHDLLITPPVSLAEFLRPAAMYVPDELRTRADYRKQEPCQHCNEMHERTVKTTRQTYCGTLDDPGCGTQIGEKETTVTLPVPPANRPEMSDAQRERLERQTAAEPDRIAGQWGTVTKNVPIDSVSKISPSPALANYSVTKNVPVESDPAAEPDRIAETIPAGLWKHPPPVNVCACGVSIPDDRKWTCSAECTGPLEVSA